MKGITGSNKATNEVGMPGRLGCSGRLMEEKAKKQAGLRKKEYTGMKHSYNLVITLCLFLAVHACTAQNGSAGLGVNTAQPVGAIAKLWTSQENQLAFGLGWSAGSERSGGYGRMLAFMPSKKNDLSLHTMGAPNDSSQTSLRDPSQYDMYGDLLNDNPDYNKQSPLWPPVLIIIAANAFTNLLDTYVLEIDFTHVGFVSWGRNLKAGFPWGPGWEWDEDRFGENFLLHPYGGSEFFNAARANGYNFWESVPFTFLGSYMWKIFGETGTPERNDLIMTTLGGNFLGETIYRLSSNVLDDQSTGFERLFRELAAAAIDPARAACRLTQGILFRATQAEVYQKEPVNITLSTGAHWVNDGREIGTGSLSEMVNLNLDYGNPFEQRSREPFDYFKLRTDLSFGVGRKVFDNAVGEGLLFGNNVQSGSLEMLIGGFQHFDYWDNRTFELGTVAFGGGVLSKLPLNANSNLYSNFHLGIVPFAGNSTSLGPDTSQFRDYNFGGGMEAKFESTLNLSGWASATFLGYYYWIRTYVGTPGDNFVGIIKPRITIRCYDNLSIGAEDLLYYTDRYPVDYPDVHEVRTEQKIFVSLYLESFKHEQ